MLEAQLAHRPDVQDLIDRNIIKGKIKNINETKEKCNLKLSLPDPKVAPAIQQHREELEKRKIEDSLRHKIDHRPTAESLIEQNILRGKKYF